MRDFSVERVRELDIVVDAAEGLFHWSLLFRFLNVAQLVKEVFFVKNCHDDELPHVRQVLCIVTFNIRISDV